MLKIGCMCRCVGTITKLDGSDGSIIWKHRRGALQSPGSFPQADFAFDIDIANGLAYVGGTNVVDEDEGVLYKLSGIDTSAITRDWYSDRNGETENDHPAFNGAQYNRVLITGDGSIVRVNGSGHLLRYNASTGQQIAASSANISNLSRIWDAGSGAVFVDVRTNTIRRYDTSNSITHSSTTPAPSSPSITASCAYGTGMFFSWTGFSTIGCRVTDSTLGTVAGTTSFSMVRAHSDGTYIFAGGGTGVRRASVSGSTISSDWTNSTTVSSGTGYSNNGANGLIFADGTDLYMVMEKTSNPSKIQKRAYSDGSITWEYDVGDAAAVPMRDMDVNAGVIAVVGSWYDSPSSADPMSVIALDTDGNLLWERFLGGAGINGGQFQVRVDGNGDVYCCGYAQ